MIARATASVAAGESTSPAGVANFNKPAESALRRQAATIRSQRTPGVIDGTAAYTTAEFRKRCGIGDYAWRQLRRRLPLRRVGKNATSWVPSGSPS